MVNTNNKIAYQISIMCRLRTVKNLAPNEIYKQETEDKVEAAETYQGEDRAARGDHAAHPVLRAKKSINKPRLAAQFGRHPTHGVRDVGKRKCEHQDPQHPAS